MRDFNKIAWMIPLISLIPFILLVFLYKPTNNLHYFQKSNLFKILMFISALINTSLWIFLSSNMLGISFYNLTQVSLFAIVSIIFLIIIGNMKLKIILRLGVLLTTGLIFFIPLILDFQNTYQPYIDIFDKLNFNIIKGIYYITIINDLFLYVITNDYYEKPISKKQLILSSLIIIMVCSLQIIDSYTLVTYKYYENLMFPSLNRYFSHKGNRFVEHYDILLLFLMLITTFFKSSHYITLSKTLIKCKNRIYNLIFFPILIIIVFILILNQEYFQFFTRIVIILSFIITLMIIFYTRKGELYDRYQAITRKNQIKK